MDYKLTLTPATLIQIISFGVTHGLPAVRSIIKAWTKTEITSEDWSKLISGWEKTPEQYLAEAEAKAKK